MVHTLHWQQRVQAWLVLHPVLLAMGLSMGTIIGTSLVRFSYALFVPAMKADLGWTYLLLGAMNTAHAAGYLCGALSLAVVIRRFSSWGSFVAGGVLSSVFLGACGWVTDASLIALLRFLSGFTSASVFAGGTVLIAQLAAQHPQRSGLLLGIYYAGGGLGMVLCAAGVPATLYLGNQWLWPHPWQLGWIGVGVMGLLMTMLMWQPAKSVPAAHQPLSSDDVTSIKKYFFVLVGYFCFGMGYIGYMTFVISLLREMAWPNWQTGLFYAAIGLSSMFSVQIWSAALDRFKAGECLAIVNTLLAVACLVPAGIAVVEKGFFHPGWSTLAVFASGMLFGGSFATAVASTTAFIRHNLPRTQWVSVITVFTSVFAVGQVFGPSLTGWISDHFAGLPGGLLFSACVLFAGALMAWQQASLTEQGKIST